MMKIQNFDIRIPTRGFCHVVNITPQVQEQIKESGVNEGIVTVFVVGSTAGISTVEYEPGLVQDLEDLFNKLVPANLDYHHEQMWHDGNGFSHVRASLLKPSVSIPIRSREMRLGTWQQLVLIDFDNRSRDREIAVQIMGI